MNEEERNLAQKLYGVFEMLRDSDEFENSGTSKILREKDSQFFLTRAEDEFAELSGVISGEHSHSGNLEEDFVLESSQVFYWLALAAIVENKSFAEFESESKEDLSKLEKLHTDNSIPFQKVFKKDLNECEEKGYL